MKRENWQKVKQIFNDALEVSPSERESFLNKICADDNELRRDVEVLLNSFEDNFLEKPAVGQVADVIAEDQTAIEAGEIIKHYRIVQKLGEGGQGTVYLAEDLQLNRNVAIKVLPSAFITNSQANKRFQREAQSIAAISHPNICAIHAVDSTENQMFLVMQFVEGKTLTEKLKKEKLDTKTAIDIAVQIADALNEAHTHGVIHRDIKPSNIIVSESNQIKVLDFGLAKRIDQINSGLSNSLTESGTVMGTAAYMSPEQARGEKPDERTDIWSLGVCVYEMLTGENPFARKSTAEIFNAILSFEPNLDDFSPQLAKIIDKALQKNADTRYKDVQTLLNDLREIQNQLQFAEMLVSHKSGKVFRKKAKLWNLKYGWKPFAITGFVLVILAIGGWFYWQNRNVKWAKENIKQIENLAQADKTFEAYDLALQVQKYLPKDENVKKLMPKISDHLNVKTEPAGAKVFLRKFLTEEGKNFPERDFIGETPLENLQIARGQYLLYIEKEGFSPFMRSISGRLPDYWVDLFEVLPIEVSVKLSEIEKVPAKMVFIPGGEYKLVSFTRPTEKTVKLGDFLIDKYEVSNAEFKGFITSGGYNKKEFWQIPFIKDGKEISFDEAIKDFKDKTGLPAPRSWTNQNFPENKANYPVTDINWYEAAAYARFRGKSLPNVYQWEKAARDGQFDQAVNTMPWGVYRDADSIDFLANFQNKGTMPVDSLEFGASSYGCLNMAGNVAEWTLNQHQGQPLISGGGWGEQIYLFGYYADYPPFYSSNRLGFRLVKNLSENENGAEEMPSIEIPEYKVSSKTDFKNWLTHYQYDKTPLEPEIIETIETDSWTREKITFIGANREKAIGYLYLPKNVSRPLQVVHWIPAADVPLGFSSLTHTVEEFIPWAIKSGRAVWTVVVKGYNERPSKDLTDDGSSIQFRNEMISKVTDWRRGLDYLETRKDIDKNKIAFLGLSLGADLGLIQTAVENRYVSLAFVGVGVRKTWSKWIDEANMVNFAPHITTQKLFFKGRYDEAHRLKSETEPIYKILSEPKRLTIIESGHIPPPEMFASTINGWLDETLGKVSK